MSGSVRLEVVDGPARVCAERLVSVARAGGQIVLTGGSTPRAAYELAAQDRDAWPGATVWFGDERCVPPDDERSNFGMARDSLLAGLGEDHAPAVHRMKGELGTVDGAADYEQQLREAGRPRFDLLLLGLGPDAHIASLFPDQDTLSEQSRLVVGVEQAGHEPFVPRISLTLPAIAAAAQVMFLVSGSSKADAVAAAFGPEAVADPHFPASMLAPLTDNVVVLLDAAAAVKL